MRFAIALVGLATAVMAHDAPPAPAGYATPEVPEVPKVPEHPVQPVQPVQPVHPVQPVQPVQPVHPVQPVQPVHPPVSPVSPPSNTTIPVKYVTETVTAFTTYCPTATEIEHGGTTITVTQATTLTIPCPTGCQVTKPVYSSVVTACSTCTHTPTATPVIPYYPSKNTTVPGFNPPIGTAVPPPSGTTPAGPISPPAYTGAASKASFGAAGILAAIGAVVAL